MVETAHTDEDKRKELFLKQKAYAGSVFGKGSYFSTAIQQKSARFLGKNGLSGNRGNVGEKVHNVTKAGTV